MQLYAVLSVNVDQVNSLAVLCKTFAPFATTFWEMSASHVTARTSCTSTWSPVFRLMASLVRVAGSVATISWWPSPAHFHACVIDGAFELDPERGARGIEVNELDANSAEVVQARVRRPLSVRWGSLLQRFRTRSQCGSHSDADRK